MATAYTSLLGLALPVTGELSGTWGNTVNTEITSLLDSAISGTTTISADADITLTTTTGAANEAREAIILWTAGGTATRNITAPAQSKAYIVINKSSSTQSIVLRGAGPTTGVTIIKGEAAVCAWDGSDFIKVSNISGAGVFSSLTVTGTTTLSGLTASTALALDASKNVVSVTNTGTGNNVLATSPTLVTPALGTPSSGVVTNLTGTASININGTVGATTPTTGSFTSLDYSTTLTGGTGIVNLGSGQFYKDASGLVGIGTTSPSSYGKFAVFGTQTVAGIGNVSGFFSDGTTVSLYILNQSTVATLQADSSLAFGSFSTERMRINTSGDVGIGTTAPGTKLDVVGNIRTRGSASPTVTFNDGTIENTLSISSSAFQLSVPSANPITFLTTNTERMRIDSSGNVGIGTTSPSKRLSLRTSSADVGMTFGAGANAYNQDIDFLNSVDSMSGRIRYYADSGFMSFWTASTERMRIDTSGNVGIGTSSPATKLEINGGATASNFLLNVNAGTYGKQSDTSIEMATSADVTPRMLFRVNGNTERMRIDSGGNVGIGTTSPVTNLNISSASAATGGDGNQYVQTTYTGTGTVNSGYTAKNYYGTSQFFQWENNGTRLGNRIITNAGGGNLIFTYGNDSEGMRIDSSGNVGIGKTATNKPLEIYAATSPAIRIQNSTTGTGAADGLLIEMTGLDALVYNYEAGNLRFATSGNEAARIDSSGNVLVGTTSAPSGSGKLTLSDSASETKFTINNTGTGGLQWWIGSTNNSSGAVGGGKLAFFDQTNNAARMVIDSSGIVTMSAYGAGAATFSASGVISSVSDETWKIKDGVPVDVDSMLNKLEPGYWYYNDEKKETFGSDRQLGFYAQNVNAAIGPEAAPIPEEGKPWGYYDRSVLAVTVMSLQKALATIESLTARITAFEST